MTVLERLMIRTQETNDSELKDCIECAKNAILARRFPYGEYPTRTVTLEDGSTVTETWVEPKYEDLLYRIALDLFNKSGAEGELGHTENGVSRTYESSWISGQLLSEIVPMVGVPR